MTILSLTSSNPRHQRAILLAADSGQWLRPSHLVAGHRAVGIPSQRVHGLYHWTDGHTCSCADYQRHQLPCKHVLAFRIDAIARPVQPQPASDTIDGLRHLLEQRLTSTAATQRYADIFERFEEN